MNRHWFSRSLDLEMIHVSTNLYLHVHTVSLDRPFDTILLSPFNNGLLRDLETRHPSGCPAIDRRLQQRLPDFNLRAAYDQSSAVSPNRFIWYTE